jgi:hypothetical protein
MMMMICLGVSRHFTSHILVSSLFFFSVLFHFPTTAASQHGLKIMAMLYLTPVLPLGLVSYACGTTTMDVSTFALAKIASLPLYLLYTFIGASAHSFIKRGAAATDAAGSSGSGIGHSVSQEAKKLEENQLLLVAGLLLSVVMMTLITRHIRKELMKVRRRRRRLASVPMFFIVFLLYSRTPTHAPIVAFHPCCTFCQILDQQKKEKVGGDSEPLLDGAETDDVDEKTLEMGLTSRSRRKATTTTSKLAVS